MGEEPEALVRCSHGDIPSQDFSVILSTVRWSLRCVPAREGGGLLVLGVLKPRRAPCARLLTASFDHGANLRFDTGGLCTLVASQTRLKVRIDQRQMEREAADDRDFITGVRRYLEALRNHTVSSTPRAMYELVERFPVRLRIRGAEAWPRAFTRPGTLLQVPTVGGQPRNVPILDVSDDGDVLTMDGDDTRGEMLEEGVLKIRPGDDSLRRMREALDAIAMGTDEAHGRLLAALTRPESLQDLPPPASPSDGEQSGRQHAARALALRTPDIALIHGPPGTGKTTVICSIIEELVKRGQRVLLVAPTHVALDNVLERVGDRSGVTAIRLGSPANVEEQAHRVATFGGVGHKLLAHIEGALGVVGT
ncbi:MAG: hypothetical protein EOO70_07110 [Myxococcaceae bacterium]|nr:MAG: hypothetical protein EOO70_07110 [Myxococcaceae bacterium]